MSFSLLLIWKQVSFNNSEMIIKAKIIYNIFSHPKDLTSLYNWNVNQTYIYLNAHFHQNSPNVKPEREKYYSIILKFYLQISS